MAADELRRHRPKVDRRRGDHAPDELRPDVILLDVKLKGETDGTEVAQQIKSLHDIPIIFTTVNVDEATVRGAITGVFS